MSVSKEKMMACQGAYLKMAEKINEMSVDCQETHGCTDLTNCPYALAVEAIGNLAEAASSCHTFYSQRFEEPDPEPEPEPEPRRRSRPARHPKTASDVVGESFPRPAEDEYPDELDDEDDDEYLQYLKDEDI